MAISSLPAHEALIASTIFRTTSGTTTTSRPKSMAQCVVFELLDHFDGELDVILSHDVCLACSRQDEVPLLEVVEVAVVVQQSLFGLLNNVLSSANLDLPSPQLSRSDAALDHKREWRKCRTLLLRRYQC